MSSRKESLRNNFAAAMRKQEEQANRSAPPTPLSHSPSDRAEAFKMKLLQQVSTLSAIVLMSPG